MPSLPTSLSVVALALAWLVVLVPMAARRREHVPESDDRSAGFRVLRRSSRRRNRRVLSRTAVASADPDERNGGVDPMDDQMLWSEDDDFEGDDEVLDGDVLDGAVRADERRRRGRRRGRGRVRGARRRPGVGRRRGPRRVALRRGRRPRTTTSRRTTNWTGRRGRGRSARRSRGRRPTTAGHDRLGAPAAHARTAPSDPRGQDRFAQWDAADEWTAETPPAPAPRAAVENPPAGSRRRSAAVRLGCVGGPGSGRHPPPRWGVRRRHRPPTRPRFAPCRADPDAADSIRRPPPRRGRSGTAGVAGSVLSCCSPSWRSRWSACSWRRQRGSARWSAGRCWSDTWPTCVDRCASRSRSGNAARPVSPGPGRSGRSTRERVAASPCHEPEAALRPRVRAGHDDRYGPLGTDGAACPLPGGHRGGSRRRRPGVLRPGEPPAPDLSPRLRAVSPRCAAGGRRRWSRRVLVG